MIEKQQNLIFQALISNILLIVHYKIHRLMYLIIKDLLKNNI